MARTLLGRYRLVAAIGTGGMGSVHLAEDRRLPGRQCAIKTHRPPAELPADQARAALDRFAEEARLLARLDHPALPKVSDHFEHGGVGYLVMDFVPGRDLAAVLNDAIARDRRLPVESILDWADALCSALAYLHQLRPPIVHRDVKPANLKLTPDGQLKLVDFGLAMRQPTGDALTVTVAGGGSRAYQPLEQYGDAVVADPRSDVYAVGATLYHLLSERAPASAQERFLRPDALVDLAGLRPDASPYVIGVVGEAMMLHPDNRPMDAAALRQRLRHAAREAAPRAAAEDGRAGHPASLWRSNRAWLAALVIMTVLAAWLTLAP